MEVKLGKECGDVMIYLCILNDVFELKFEDMTEIPTDIDLPWDWAKFKIDEDKMSLVQIGNVLGVEVGNLCESIMYYKAAYGRKQDSTPKDYEYFISNSRTCVARNAKNIIGILGILARRVGFSLEEETFRVQKENISRFDERNYAKRQITKKIKKVEI